MANIDKDALLAELRNSTQSPRAVEVVIQRLEQGAFEAAAESPKESKGKGGKQKPETGVAPSDDVEER